MKKDKKILFCVTNSDLGGAQRYIIDLATILLKRNYDVGVACGGDGKAFNQLQKNGAKIFILHSLTREIRPIKDRQALFQLISIFKKEKPDILHLNSTKVSIVGSIAGRMANIKKIIYTVHGFVFLEPLPLWKKWFYIVAEKFTSYFKNIIICVSDFDKRVGIKYKIAPEQKFITIHNGINISSLNLLSREVAINHLLKSCKLQATSYKFIIGTIANFYPTKGLIYFIRSAAMVIKKYPQTLFFVIGDGALRNQLRAEIQKHQLEKRFFLLGAPPSDSQYLPAFDLYVCSSVKEGFPYSLLEAMAAHVPIIATDVGGISEMITKDSGILIQPKNEKMLAAQIENFIRSPQDMKRYSDNAKKRLDELFAIDTMAQKTIGIYEK